MYLRVGVVDLLEDLAVLIDSSTSSRPDTSAASETSREFVRGVR
jgi:hypothetical protein